MIVLEVILLAGLIVTAVSAALCRRLLNTVIVYMAFSLNRYASLWNTVEKCRWQGW